MEYPSGNEIRTMRFKKEGNEGDFGSGGYLFGRHRECDKMYVHFASSLIVALLHCRDQITNNLSY